MFQRQSPRPFPARNILILVAAVLAFLFFLLKSLNKKEKAAAPPVEQTSEKEGGLRPAEWFHALREYPDFRTDVNTYAAAMKQAANPVAWRSGAPGFSAPWTVQGPANIGARVNTIKVHPANPDIIYIGYSHGGVWKTTDGGLSWLPIFDQQPFLAIGDIELNPQNPNIIYVGTGDPNISGYPFIGDGLWKSSDGGQTWQHLGLENQRIVSKIVIHPTNPNLLYVATMGLPFERNNDRGLYKSTNGGQTWQQVLFVSDSTGIIDLTMSPDNPNVLYAAAWDRIRNNQETIASGFNARIWKTVNAGATWTMLSNGLPQGEKSRIGLSIDTQNPDRLVAMYADSTLRFHAIYQTLDGGQHWQKNVSSGLPPDFQSDFAWYFGKIFINPFNPDDLFACGVNLWRSVDGGNFWFQATPEWWLYEVHADMHDMAFIDANTCLLATDGGLYKSIDSGTSWAKIENIPTSQFYRVAHNPLVPDWYWGGMQDNGTSGGNAGVAADWQRYFGGDGFQAVFHPEDPDVFYFETQNGNIWRYDIDAAMYKRATIGIDSSDRRHWDMPYLLSRHDLETMYTGTYRVYQSFGHPPFWFPISEDLTDGVVFGNRFHTISTLDESYFQPEILYVGTTDGNVWRGNLLQQSWTNITAGLPDRYVSSVKSSPNFSNRVYVAHTGYKSNDFSPHIHRSDNQGQTWTAIAGDLPNLAVNDLHILPGHQDSVVFAATDGGVYATLDGGQHWERLGSGMPAVPVYDLEINPAERTLVAGTYARSIMTFPLDSLQFDGSVSTDELKNSTAPKLVVSPNPASVQAKLTLENVSLKQKTEVAIANLAGQIVWQKQFDGSRFQETSFDVQHLAPGVYLAFARTGGNVWGQQKFVIAR